MLGGARLTGRAGPYSIGALNIQTERRARRRGAGHQLHRAPPQAQPAAPQQRRRDRDAPRTGVRQPPAVTGEPSYTAGADATMLFFKSINLTAITRCTSTPGRAAARRRRLELPRTVRLHRRSLRRRRRAHADRSRTSRRRWVTSAARDVRRSFGKLRFSPRPRAQPRGAQAHLAGQPRLPDRRRGDRRCRAARPAGCSAIDFQSSDQVVAGVSREYELLPARFAIAPGVVVPAGGYYYRHHARDATRWASSGASPAGSRRRPARSTAARGPRSRYSGRWGVVPRFSIEPSVTFNWVHLPYGDFTARLVSSRFTVTPSARMLISSLVQFNADAHDAHVERAAAMGIHRRQRAVRGLQRRPGHRRLGVSGPGEPDIGDQGDAAVQVLKPPGEFPTGR